MPGIAIVVGSNRERQQSSWINSYSRAVQFSSSSVPNFSTDYFPQIETTPDTQLPIPITDDSFDSACEAELLIVNLPHLGKSSLSQSTFNAINILMVFVRLSFLIFKGIGLLSLPFAFRLLGWVLGFACLLCFALITRYTAKMLAKCMDYSSRGSTHIPVITYADMGELAFGYKGRLFISVVFLLELFAALCALLILMSDSLFVLIPSIELNYFKCLVALLVLPTTFPRSLRWLAYGSIIGIIALINLITIIFFDGFTKKELPGSIMSPMPTELFATSSSGFFAIPLAFGLIMSCFGGHSVFPQLYRDMQTPKNIIGGDGAAGERFKAYSRMVDFTYLFTTVFYAAIASIGYLMFGTTLLQEITQNMAEIPEYNSTLTKITIWLVAVNPFTKYALTLNPLSITFELLILNKFRKLESYAMHIRILVSTLATAAVVVVSILVPGFHQVMGLLVIFPCLCYLKLYGGFFLTNEEKLERENSFLRCNNDLDDEDQIIGNNMIDEEEEEQQRLGKVEVFVCFCLILFGSVIAIFGTISSLVLSQPLMYTGESFFDLNK